MTSVLSEKHFHDEAAARAHLESIRWPNGPVCAHCGEAENIRIVRVPGAFEIPSAARTLAQTKQYDAILCVGCLLRGDTLHYDGMEEWLRPFKVSVALVPSAKVPPPATVPPATGSALTVIVRTGAKFATSEWFTSAANV